VKATPSWSCSESSMKEFQSYSPESAIEENLRESALRMEMLSEQEISHLREFAEEITADCTEYPDWIASLPDSILPTARLLSKPLKQNAGSLEGMHPLHRVWQSVILCGEIKKLLAEKNLLTPRFFFLEMNDATPPETCRVAYQRNSYSDSAYLQFSKLLQDPRVSYSHSFLSACEDVYNGICEYCILPVESSSEGQLNSFSRLIERYDLKITATCEVMAGNDAAKITRFALLSRSLTVSFQTGKEAFFEFATPPGVSPSEASILSAAELCGLTLYRLDSLPASEPHKFSTHYLFKTKNADLYTFLIYLAMEVPHYDMIGIYSHL